MQADRSFRGVLSGIEGTPFKQALAINATGRGTGSGRAGPVVEIESEPPTGRPQPRRRPVSAYAFNWSPTGRSRMRLPVALKMALVSAGSTGGTPGSPTPVAWVAKRCGTMWV